MESLMTAKLVDDITDTHSSKTRESIGQGIADIITGFFGGMGGMAAWAAWAAWVAWAAWAAAP
jgi:SulP family sulfate permease